jgi:hypothetical protein
VDLTAADKLTVARAASVPLVVVLYAWSFPNHDYWATAVFCVAMTTDWLDGQLARRQGHTSSVGSLLDPIADKILVLAALVMLIEQGVAPAWMVAAIVVREVLITGLRQAAVERGVVPPWPALPLQAPGPTARRGGRCSSPSSSPGSRASTTLAAPRGCSAALRPNSAGRQAAMPRVSHHSSNRAHARRYSRIA